jgi:uncharacterized protein YutE (UPF0331/DUF86 family)
MSLPEAHEADVLENLLPEYQAEGFDVYVNPSASLLPEFMKSHRPDAVALRSDKKIVIEVVRPTGGSARKIQELQSLLASHGDWELRVVYVSPLGSEKLIEVASRPAINNAIQRVLDLKQDGHKLPALIMAWAALEAIGRALLPERFRRPQTPARLIEVLATEGYLTPAEADALRAAISTRNSAVHGGLDPAVDEQQLEQLITVLRTLADFVPTEVSAS